MHRQHQTRQQRLTVRPAVVALLLLGALLTACSALPISPSNDPSTLDPQGPASADLASLWWVMFGMSAVIYVLVLGLLFAALLRRRRATAETPAESNDRKGRNWVVWGGIALPVVVLLTTFGFTMRSLASTTSKEDNNALTIDVIGRRWWWQVSYKAQGIDTANELHIPVGVPVRIRVQSYDVIHSFWIPQLHGKMDAIPGRVNTLTIQADEPGVYRGLCAEYCGLQHAHMNFIAVAESQADFDAWIAQQRQPAGPPADDAAARGQQVFVEAGCVYCHYVRGLNDSAVDRSDVDLGPDLTHLASRLTIAAGARYNNRGNLAGWVMDSQHIKPGNMMPPMLLSGDDLLNLLAYLEGLR